MVEDTCANRWTKKSSTLLEENSTEEATPSTADKGVNDAGQRLHDLSVLLELTRSIHNNQNGMLDAIKEAAANADSATAWTKSELHRQSQQVDELYKMLATQSPVIGGVASATHADTSPIPTTRRNRPRSGSVPPRLTCIHHAAGNTNKHSPADLHGMIVVSHAADAGPWFSHIGSTLLYDKQPLSDALWDWLELQFAERRIVLYHYFSPRVRHFTMKCTLCDEQFNMRYDKNLSQETKEKGITALARFSHCTEAATQVGSCPRLRSDKAHALTLANG